MAVQGFVPSKAVINSPRCSSDPSALVDGFELVASMVFSLFLNDQCHSECISTSAANERNEVFSTDIDSSLARLCGAMDSSLASP
ncbi:Uncharacterized protein APZ42_020537 [Daphnia magna]|uniref:Uncharacterized protein n=1 Tax=Daphnia magna TaxID=35525 RepID=A0A164X683_9CRUS|nr:Uncharacterized protein APZ42_020537 [Daphnia magna]